MLNEWREMGVVKARLQCLLVPVGREVKSRGLAKKQNGDGRRRALDGKGKEGSQDQARRKFDEVHTPWCWAAGELILSGVAHRRIRFVLLRRTILGLTTKREAQRVSKGGPGSLESKPACWEHEQGLQMASASERGVDSTRTQAMGRQGRGCASGRLASPNGKALERFW